MHCGMCLPTCPTYDTTKRERNSPRGRIALMRAIADGELAVSREFAEEMSYCLGCLGVSDGMPGRRELRRALRDRPQRHRDGGRASGPRAEGLAGADAALSSSCIRARCARAGRLLRVYQRSGLERLVRRSGASASSAARHCGALEPQAPRVAPHFHSADCAREERPAGAVRHRVALLTGCVQDLVFADGRIAIPPTCCSRTAARLIRRPFSPAAVRSTRTTATSTERGSWRAG